MLSTILSWLASLGFSDWWTVLTWFGGVLIGAPTSIKKATGWRRRRRLAFLFPRNDVVIYIPARDVGRSLPVIAKEDQEAANRAKEILISNGFDVEIEYTTIEGYFTIKNTKSYLIICGPKNSKYVEEAFRAMPYISFVNQDGKWLFSDLGSHNHIMSPMDRDPPEDGDLAFLGKVVIPSQPATPVVLICGIHALGSLGISYFLEDQQNVDQLLAQVKKSKFVSIVRSKYSKEKNDVIEAEFHFGPKTHG